MFTLQDIDVAHGEVKSGADFPRYVQALKRLGVLRYESFVSDGHAEYFGADGYHVISEGKHQVFPVADESSAEQLSACLTAHQNGDTNYVTFSQEAAAAGVEKWTVDIQAMTCIYYDKRSAILYQETIPTVND